MIYLTGTPADWSRELDGGVEVSKYHAKRTTIDGITFDSQAEARRYSELKLLQEAGAIRGLELQTSFTILDGFKRNGKAINAITYRADFTYWEDGHFVAEDVKGMVTPVYAIKRKMFLSRYPDIDFREVEA
jgi:hypothetical protein